MKVTKDMVERAIEIERLQSAGYQTGSMPVTVDDDELRSRYPNGIPTYTQLCDFPHASLTDQTTRELMSFTAALAHLLSVSGGSFVTAITEEAASYIDENAVADYKSYLRAACKTNNLQPPEGL